MLAARLLSDQGIEVTALCFTSNFYNSAKAKEGAAQLGIPLLEYDLTKKMIELVKNPPNGYGKNLNPCIDCHGLMIKIAGRIALEKKFDLVATGEVLGQRPFSQNKRSLAAVAELSGVDVLRPLSAKLLPPTLVEKKGLVRRGLLMDIRGRARERQLELVKKLNIKEFPSPSGGCLLTEPEFSERLGKMLDYWPACSGNDVELLKNGRVQWLRGESNDRILLLIGRNETENNILEKLVRSKDVTVELRDINGPLTAIRGLKADGLELDIGSMTIPGDLKKSELLLNENKTKEEIIRIAALLTGYYAVKARDKQAAFVIKLVKE